MARVTDNTVVLNPDTGQIVQLAAGDEVPSWAEVGDHLLEAKPEASKSAPRKAKADDSE